MIRKSVKRFSDKIMPETKASTLADFNNLFTHFAPPGAGNDIQCEALPAFPRRIVLEAWV